MLIDPLITAVSTTNKKLLKQTIKHLKTQNDQPDFHYVLDLIAQKYKNIELVMPVLLDMRKQMIIQKPRT